MINDTLINKPQPNSVSKGYAYGVTSKLPVSFYTQTPPQTYLQPNMLGHLPKQNSRRINITHEEYYECSLNPVVTFYLDFITSKLNGVPWFYEANTQLGVDQMTMQPICDFIKEQIDRIRDTVIVEGLRSMLIYGWSPYEILWQYDEERELMTINKLKPLLHEQTFINVDEQTGDFNGFRQEMAAPNANKFPVQNIRVTNSFLLSDYGHNQNWYGQSALDSVIPLWYEWNSINRQSAEFFNRRAGSLIIVRYPPGKEPDEVDSQGRTIPGKDHHDIAKQLLKDTENSYGCVLPSTLARTVDNPNSQEYEWTIEEIPLLANNVSAYQMRQQQIEEWISNALSLTARVRQENDVGARAELQQYVDTAVTMLENKNHLIGNMIQTQLIDRLCQINFGKKGLVKLKIGSAQTEMMMFGPGTDTTLMQAGGMMGQEEQIPTDGMDDTSQNNTIVQ